MPKRGCRFWTSFFALMLFVAAGVHAQTPAPPAPLSEDERKAARELADVSIKDRGMRMEGPLYLVSVELFRDKEAEEKGVADRKALVTHYRYADDTTILTFVNLSHPGIMAVETKTNLPTRLSEEEFTRAKELALRDPRVREALGADADRVVIEPLVVRAASREDPFFGRRVVRLLFRIGPDYLSAPEVNVDLTSGKVLVERPASRETR